MSKEDIDVHVVFGLGNGIGLGSKGYVVFSKTRCANLKFYQWFNTTILLEFIKDLKAFRNLPFESITWFQLDGEAIQIECYQSANMLEALRENNNVVIGKPAAL